MEPTTYIALQTRESQTIEEEYIDINLVPVKENYPEFGEGFLDFLDNLPSVVIYGIVENISRHTKS